MNYNINKLDAHTYDVSQAHKPTLRRAPRTRTVALSDCVCYDADGNVLRTIARNAHSRTTVAKRTPPHIVRDTRPEVLRYNVGNIGNVE